LFLAGFLFKWAAHALLYIIRYFCSPSKYSMMRLLKHFVLFCILLQLLSGCISSPYFQQTAPIPKYAWSYDYKPTFKFNIEDTNYLYQTYFIIRHTQGYPFSNIWLLVDVKFPEDVAVRHERVNIQMAEPSGKWLGRGIGEIYEQRLLLKLSDSLLFRRKGTYEVAFRQNMRVNPLPEIMDIGIRVEKTNMPSHRK
jgi:gliding motility-associated lipoprotein GldH